MLGPLALLDFDRKPLEPPAVTSDSLFGSAKSGTPRPSRQRYSPEVLLCLLCLGFIV